MMYWLKLAMKNLLSRPLSSFLTVLLLSLGISISAFLMLTEKHLTENFGKNLAGVDLILGAKGSPLQTVLCNLYHIDSPTGNIEIDQIKAFLNPAHPLVALRAPLLLGDSYSTYRIVGTTYEFLDFYDASVAEGRMWHKPFEAVIGHQLAKAMKLTTGSKFRSTHGLLPGEDEHEHDFTVSGILAPTGSVIDQLVLTSPQTIWDSHHHEDHDDEEGDHTGHSHAEHIDTAAVELLGHPGQSITSVLLRLKNHNFQSLNLARNINENTEIQASNPAIELNRLYDTMGIGEKILKYLVVLLLTVGGISIFVALLQALKDRKYEFAIMRVMGGSRLKLSVLAMAEAMLLCLAGLALGLLTAHLGFWFFGSYTFDKYKYSFDAWQWIAEESRLCLLVAGIGLLAGVFPALSAYRTNISETLTNP